MGKTRLQNGEKTGYKMEKNIIKYRTTQKRSKDSKFLEKRLQKKENSDKSQAGKLVLEKTRLQNGENSTFRKQNAKESFHLLLLFYLFP